VAKQVARIDSLAPPSTAKHLKVVGRTGDDYILLDIEEVLAFQADAELVWIVTSGQRLLATENLRAIERRLTDHRFKRVHRNAIVNLDHIRKVSAMSSQRWLLTLSNSLQITASKRQAFNIRKLLRP
jgi:DNA-binding LytR/AlgR family response regulator